MRNQTLDVKDLKAGKIYLIEYGENTCVLVRFKDIVGTRINFFSHLHYWKGYETFHENGYSVKSGITNIRPASKPEKHSLFCKEVENGVV